MSGGNVHYVDGKEDQGWHQTCLDLVKSRFIATDFIVSTIHVQHGSYKHVVTHVQCMTLYTTCTCTLYIYCLISCIIIINSSLCFNDVHTCTCMYSACTCMFKYMCNLVGI